MRVRRACRSLHYSPRFNGQFSDGRGLAGTRMSPFWILLQLRMLKAVVTTGDKSYAELQSNRRHQQTNSEHFTGWMPFLSPNEQCQSEHWKEWSLCFHRKKSIRLFFQYFCHWLQRTALCDASNFLRVELYQFYIIYVAILQPLYLRNGWSFVYFVHL